MKNLLKTTTRIFAALAVCVAVSACSHPVGSEAGAAFPSYNAAASVSGFVAPSIMDY